MRIHRLLLVFLMERLTIIVGYIPTIQLEDSLITGYTLKSIHGRDIDAFNNIPYAEPPVGDLRFKPSIPLKKLPKLFNASSPDSVQCVQFDVLTFSKDMIGREDCLTVNIYAPRQRESTKPLPVLVVIHGGVFMFFSNSDMYFGPNKLLDFDVVLVTVNYRLGVLGFFSTGDEASPGNYALWDLLTSLQWVQKNIQSFGGNPNSVTLLGHSSGAMCVTVLMVSPLAKGLFHKVFLQSGTIFAPKMIHLNPLPEAQSLADAFWCPTTPTQALVDCLRKQPVKKLTHYGYLVPFEKNLRIVPRFLPVIDHVILHEHPINLYSKGLFHRVPVITGLSGNEGLLFYYLVLRSELRYYEDEINIYENHQDAMLQALVHTTESLSFLKECMKEHYFKDVDASDYITIRKEFTRFISDMVFFAPAVNFVNYISNFTTTYFYYFEYKSTFSLTNVFTILNDPFFDNTSIIHGDELKFLFSGYYDFYKMSKSEMDFQDSFLKLWINFIYSGNPTPDGFPVQWQPVRNSSNEFLQIGEQMKMKADFHKKDIDYVNSIILPCINKLDRHLFVNITIDFNVNCVINVTSGMVVSNYSKSTRITTNNIYNYYVYLMWTLFLLGMILFLAFTCRKFNSKSTIGLRSKHV